MQAPIIFYFTIILFVSINVENSQQLSLIPSVEDCFSELFNETAEGIEAIVNNFKFSASNEDITIYQFKSDGTNVTLNLANLEGANTLSVNLNQAIIFIIHGWRSGGNSDWVAQMASAYHSIGISNTFSVDWSPLASKINYAASAAATKSTGTILGKWLYNFLNKNASLIERVHLVGHSLGAHVSGFIGKTVKNESNSEAIIGRISGLDVAAPLFETLIRQAAKNRLNSTDAKEVDAYHTDAGLLGFKSAVAQQDFYINNGGPIQPGCNATILKIFDAIICSHGFSHVVFEKTIRNPNYIARECRTVTLNKLGLCKSNSAAEMGEHNNVTSLTGTFYGNTDAFGDPI